MTLLLSKEDVTGLLSMEAAITVLETAFADFTRKTVVMPQRPTIAVSKHNGLCGFMPAYLPQMGALGIKTVTSFRENEPRYGLPTLFGVVALLDDRTGVPLAIMDGTYLTNVRTGAASAVATKYLAREDARILGVLGSGAQAEAQIWAICQVRPIEEVRVYSPNLKHKQGAFLRALAPLVDVPVWVVDGASDAVRDCDVVVLATSAPRPVIDGDWLAAGTHINGVGSHTPQTRELDTKTLRRARVVCDSVEACLLEAGDLLIPIAEGKLSKEDICGELGEVICSQKKGRENDEDITLFKSVGLAFQDISVAMLVYRKARQQGLGTEFQFFN